MTEKSLREEIDDIHRAEQPVQKYWAQISAIAVLIFGLGGAWFKIDSLADEVSRTQTQAQNNTKDAQSVAQRLVRIEGNQERFKADVDELDEKVEKLDEKLDKILEEVRKQ